MGAELWQLGGAQLRVTQTTVLGRKPGCLHGLGFRCGLAAFWEKGERSSFQHMVRQGYNVGVVFRRVGLFAIFVSTRFRLVCGIRVWPGPSVLGSVYWGKIVRLQTERDP